MKGKNVLFILLCFTLVISCVIGVKAYKSNAADSAQLNGDVTAVNTANDREYLTETDKKLKEKFGVSVNDNMIVNVAAGVFSGEFVDLSSEQKRIVWDFLINDIERCDDADEMPDLSVNCTIIMIGGKKLVPSGYYNNGKDYACFKMDNDDALYRVTHKSYYQFIYDFVTENGKKPNEELKQKVDEIIDKVQEGAYNDLITDDPEVYNPEEQAYLADMDKKLEEKFGINTKMRVYDYPFGLNKELSFSFKKRVWEMLANDFELIEKPEEEPEILYGSGGYKIGNHIIFTAGYYTEDRENSYFLFDNSKLYRVKEKTSADLSTDIFSEYYANH